MCARIKPRAESRGTNFSPLVLDALHILTGDLAHSKQEAKISAPTPKQPHPYHWMLEGVQDPISRVCPALGSRANGISLSGLHAKPAQSL